MVRPANPHTVKPSYPRFYWLSLILPAVTLLTYLLRFLFASGLGYAITALAVCISAYILYHQLSQLYPAFKYSKLAKREIALLIGGSLLVPIALFSGDTVGILRYGSYDSSTNFGLGLLASGIAVCASLFMGLLAISNTIFFATDARNKIVNALGMAGYVILWLLIAVISYFGYVILYGSHDPSTE